MYRPARKRASFAGKLPRARILDPSTLPPPKKIGKGRDLGQDWGSRSVLFKSGGPPEMIMLIEVNLLMCFGGPLVSTLGVRSQKSVNSSSEVNLWAWCVCISSRDGGNGVRALKDTAGLSRWWQYHRT